MFDFIFNSLAPICFVFELLALFLSFYLKDSRIFFITLALLCARFTYLYASLYQAHLFVSLFLPFIFVLFVVLKKSILVFEKKSLVKLAVLVFVGILALFLTKNTNFNEGMSRALFDLSFFTPISGVSFIFFVTEFLFLLLWGILKNELHFTFAFVLAFIQFLFASNIQNSFFEFTSLFFVCYLVWHSYKSLYFDTITKLPNQKALKRMLLGLESYFLGGLRLEDLSGLNPKQEKILLKKIAKILKKQDKKVRVFRVDNDFIFVFKGESENAAKEFLCTLQKGFDNTNSWLKDKEFKLITSTALIKNQAKFEENLNMLKANLVTKKRS